MKQHREREVGVAYREFSWAFGLDRLLSGYAMQAGDDCIPLAFRLWTKLKVASRGAGWLCAFLAAPHGLREQLPGKRAWRPGTSCCWACWTNFMPRTKTRRAPSSLREGIEELRQAETGLAQRRNDAGGYARRGAAGAGANRERRHPWSEGVKFCSLLPMRGVPFQVVYLLGMNMEDYPRRQERPSFDLLRDDYRPGDRSARIDDRWLFLEALLSARQALHMSYIGQDMHRNEAREPSVVVKELIDYIRDGYQAMHLFEPDGKPARPPTCIPATRCNRSVRTTSRAIVDDGRRFSFNQQELRNRRGPTAGPAGRLALRRMRRAGQLRCGRPATVEVALDDFVAFLPTRPGGFSGTRA